MDGNNKAFDHIGIKRISDNEFSIFKKIGRDVFSALQVIFGDIEIFADGEKIDGNIVCWVGSGGYEKVIRDGDGNIVADGDEIATEYIESKVILKVA